MTDFQNPYEAPKASLIPEGDGGVWRSGGALVTRPGSSLPPRCVKCNAPSMEPAKDRRVYWHHPALYLLIIFPGLLIYAIVALIVRKSALVNPALCAEHRQKRNLGLAIGWVGSLLGLVLMVAGPAAYDSCGLGVAGLLLFLGAIIAAMFMARIVYPERIDKDFVRLKGCGDAFLGSLPEFHG